MDALPLREFHQRLGARFRNVDGLEVISDYGDRDAEASALNDAAGLLDLSSRGRLCVVGADRERFLNGQVTNDVKALREGGGCYAALVTAKGKLESDLNIYRLKDELLVDFEPGLGARVIERLEKYVIADDVRIANAAPHYGLLSVQGPRSGEVVGRLELCPELPEEPLSLARVQHETLGELYLTHQPRFGLAGFDSYVPAASAGAVMDKLIASVRISGGLLCGWDAAESVRIEAAVPRYPVDMDPANLAPEAGIEECAISYSKGCYIGQEVIARIRTRGQVTKALRGLRLADDLSALPVKGDKLLKDGREVGYLTSALKSTRHNANIALGYVRREANALGTELSLKTDAGESPARVVCLPFAPEWS